MAAVAVLGVFNADLIFRAPRLPAMGETILGESFAIGPGGKGSNQAVAVARSGGEARMITRIGADSFGGIAETVWREAGVDLGAVIRDPDRSTGTAFIFVSTETGDNAIIVGPGAAMALSPADILGAEGVIASSRVFLSQFEAPVAAVQAGLETARRHGVTTILNPAPAISGDPALVSLCDYVTPNETEAGMLTGRQVEGESDALAAADELLRRGARNVVVTRGEHGVLLHGAVGTHRVPAFRVDQVVDTTGAGDAFNGGFATALAEGLSPVEAARFGCATAALSVTRHGAASAMPHRHEIEAMLGR